ncbi:DUF91 domain-containing protein [bacterium]|nr:DUF91 domain-containing protein [bacterium]
MAEHATIKNLVIDSYQSEGGMPAYEKLTEMVRRQFPNSKWSATHYAWYKSQIKTGKIQLTSEVVAGNSDESEDSVEAAIEESLDAVISLERDIQGYLGSRLSDLEEGLVLKENGVEFSTDAGRIDLLAVDRDGVPVVIEVKAGRARDSAFGQLLGYMGCLSESQENGERVRGILVASSFDKRVVYAARSLPEVKLVGYHVSFEFGEVS